MRFGRNILLYLLVISLTVFGFVLSQETEAAIIVLPGSGSIGTGYTITLIGFDGGEDVSLVISSAANNEIYFETTLTVDDDGSASTVIFSQRDDAPGEYLVQASANEGASASASFQILSDEEAEQRAAPTPLYRETIAVENGQWAGETTADAGIIAYAFSANAGDILDIRLNSEVFDAYLVLLDEAGNELAMDDDGGADLNAHIAEYTLPEAGHFTLLATSWRFYQLGESSVGEFLLIFELQQDGVAAPASEGGMSTITAESGGEEGIETEISDTLSEAEPLMRYTFTGSAGQSISVRLRSDDFDPYLVIENAAGETLVSDDDGDGGLNALLEDFTLPEDGSYTIVVSSWEHLHVDDAIASGAFNLWVWGDAVQWQTDEAMSETAAPAEAPEPPDQDTNADTETSDEEAESATDAEEAEAAADSDDSEEGMAAAATVEETAEPHESADIPIAYGDRLSLPIGEDDAGLRYTLTGVAGDRINIAVASFSKLDTHIAVYAPDGNLLAADDDSGRGYNPELLGLYLPADGPYLIVLQPIWQGDGQPISIAIDLRDPLVLGEGAVSIKLNHKQTIEIVTLAVESGEEIRLHASIDGAAADEQFQFDTLQNGTSLATLQVSGVHEVEWRFAAREAGTIRIVIGNGGIGEATISLSRVNEDVPVEAAGDEE